MTAWLKDAGGFYPVKSRAVFEAFYHQQRAEWRKLAQENGIRVKQ